MVNRWPQSVLRQRMKRFLTHARDPQIQAIIAPLGYDLAVLAEAEAMVQQWSDLQEESHRLDVAGQTATRRKTKAKEAAEAEDRAFCDLIDLYFPTDPRVRDTLAMPARRRPKSDQPDDGVNERPAEADGDQSAAAVEKQGIEPAGDKAVSSVGDGPPPEANPKPGSTAKPTAKKRQHPPRSTAAYINRWQNHFANTENLDNEYQALLTRFGWPPARCQAALALVKAYGEADADQKSHKAMYRTTTKAAGSIERDIRDWYRLAAGLCNPAIRRDAPDNYQELLDLLGL